MFDARQLDQPGQARGEQPARRRVVLLGASNLARGIATVLETARRIWGRPLDVFTALGMGRSYGENSRLIGRELPGIRQCGLWDALNRSEPAPTAALVTDIGNDLLYGFTPPQITGWVEQCCDRLAAVEARTVVTLLPVANLPSLSQWRFRLVRNVMFPGCRLTLDIVSARAFELNDMVRELAERRGIPIVEQRTEWYGFDPIHIRARHWPHAWRDVLKGWTNAAEHPQPARRSWAGSLYLLSRKPERRRVLGIEQRGKQPAARFSDGTTVSIF